MQLILYLLMLMALAFGAQANAVEGVPAVSAKGHEAGGTAGVKWHPGHYILLYPNQEEPDYFYAVMRDLRANPIFRGVMKTYFWNKLEPRYGVYDFSEIRADLTNLARINRQLVVAIQGVSFVSNEKLVPSYLLADKYEGGVYPINTGKGFNVAYYNAKVQDRLIALLAALGKEFDGDPNLEAVRLQETSPSRQDPEWGRAHVTKYMAGMLRVAIAAKAAFPHTVVIQYINYPVRFLPRFVDTLQSAGIGTGGPDVYQNDTSLAQGAYSYYPGVSGVVPIGVSIDYHNYQSSVGGDAPLDKPSIGSIFNFAVDKLRPNYMFWLRRTREPLNGSNYWQDVLSYFKDNDWRVDPSGGLDSTCPKAIAPCRQ